MIRLSVVQDVIAHWLDLMNVEGWIPREQILGTEARSKVPMVSYNPSRATYSIYVCTRMHSGHGCRELEDKWSMLQKNLHNRQSKFDSTMVQMVIFFCTTDNPNSIPRWSVMHVWRS